MKNLLLSNELPFNEACCSACGVCSANTGGKVFSEQHYKAQDEEKRCSGSPVSQIHSCCCSDQLSTDLIPRAEVLIVQRQDREPWPGPPQRSFKFLRQV